jgi:hypothetical protein
MKTDSGFVWNSTRLVTLATNLFPARLRIGGSDQKGFKYDDAFFQNTWPQVTGLIKQLKAGGIGTIFGLNPSLTEISTLIAHPDAAAVWGWEFGNEPSQKGGSKSGKALGQSFAALRTMLDNQFGANATKLLGPDLAYPAWGSWSQSYVDAFFQEAGSSVLDSAVLHLYPFDHNDVGGDEDVRDNNVGDPICKSESKAQGWCNYTRVLWAGPDELPDNNAMQVHISYLYCLALVSLYVYTSALRFS